jgi:hypothetical protein
MVRTHHLNFHIGYLLAAFLQNMFTIWSSNGKKKIQITKKRLNYL